MKLALQLGYKNLVGAGLRTWLNAGVLSFCFIIIIFFNGLIDGWNQQARIDSTEWEVANGHLLHENYDTSDPFSIKDGHGELPQQENLTPVLIRQASIYPDGRMVNISLKGIKPAQQTIKLPTQLLSTSDAEIPAIIGKRMANAAKLKKGDQVLLRWRDKNGTFDAANITIVDVFDCNVATIDAGQVWISMDKLWEMTGLNNRATYLIANNKYQHQNIAHWNFKDKEELLQELTNLIETKKVSGAIFYLLLLTIALLAIFDTQVLSIFRRQKEIGTYISLGMTRWEVVKLFTVEGSFYSIFGMLLASIYGTPLLIYIAKKGIAFPSEAADGMGISISDVIHPVFGLSLIVGTIVLVIISATIVSFLPARKIAKMNPVLALKGKVQ